MPKRITIILLNDDAIAREGVAALLRVRPEFHILGTAADLDAAVRMVHQTAPEVVLLTLPARGQPSVTLLGALRRASPLSRLIIMGMKPRREDVMGFVRAGVSGFTMAKASFDHLLYAIRSVMRGARFLPPELTPSLFGQLMRGRSGRRATVPVVEIAVTGGTSLIPAA